MKPRIERIKVKRGGPLEKDFSCLGIFLCRGAGIMTTQRTGAGVNQVENLLTVLHP